MKSITIQDNIEKIYENAFESCSRLEQVIFEGTGLIEIGKLAFVDCISLQEINIPQSVSLIGYGAFLKCRQLKQIVLPGDLSEVGPYWFSGCSALESVVMPKDATIIRYNAFSDCSALKSIEIPDKVTNIEVEAFAGCVSLNNIVMSSSIEKIAGSAFRDCNNVTGNEYQGAIYIGTADNDHFMLFKADTQISECIIHPEAEHIAPEAFVGCSNITKIRIPENIRVVGSDAFARCTRLEIFEITSGFYAGEYALHTGTAQAWVKVDNIEIWLDMEFENALANPLSAWGWSGLMVNGEDISSLVIPEGVKVIGKYAFYGMQSLLEVEIPESVEIIDEYAFAGCINLSKVIIKGQNTHIAENAFDGIKK